MLLILVTFLAAFFLEKHMYKSMFGPNRLLFARLCKHHYNVTKAVCGHWLCKFWCNDTTKSKRRKICTQMTQAPDLTSSFKIRKQAIFNKRWRHDVIIPVKRNSLCSATNGSVIHLSFLNVASHNYLSCCQVVIPGYNASFVEHRTAVTFFAVSNIVWGRVVSHRWLILPQTPSFRINRASHLSDVGTALWWQQTTQRLRPSSLDAYCASSHSQPFPFFGFCLLLQHKTLLARAWENNDLCN